MSSPSDDASNFSPSACSIPGHASTYGLGIRISFYLLWFGMLLAHSLSPVLFFSSGFRAEIPLRVAHLIIAYAVFIGLAMETSSPARDFQAAEVYVTSLVLSLQVNPTPVASRYADFPAPLAVPSDSPFFVNSTRLSTSSL